MPVGHGFGCLPTFHRDLKLAQRNTPPFTFLNRVQVRWRPPKAGAALNCAAGEFENLIFAIFLPPYFFLLRMQRFMHFFRARLPFPAHFFEQRPIFFDTACSPFRSVSDLSKRVRIGLVRCQVHRACAVRLKRLRLLVLWHFE